MVNGCGGSLASPKLGGGKWWWQSMGRKKGGGAPGLELVHGIGFWKFISNEWHRFSSHIKLIPGDGSRISF